MIESFNGEKVDLIIAGNYSKFVAYTLNKAMPNQNILIANDKKAKLMNITDLCFNMTKLLNNLDEKNNELLNTIDIIPITKKRFGWLERIKNFFKVSRN